MIVDEVGNSPRIIAMVIPQKNSLHKNVKAHLPEYMVSPNELEELTEIDFFPDLPQELQRKVQAARATRVWDTRRDAE
jgi:hypothetical protein